MKAFILLALSTLASAQINGQPRSLPLIEVQQTRSFREVPSIAITFANGVKDSMVLERFYPTQESRMARTPSCNFIGHLENEKTACVSLTGCASSDDLHFTINSKNSGSSNMYILHKDGNLELVESAFKDSRVTSGTARVPGSQRNGGFHLKGDDEMVNDDDVSEEMKFEKLCASGNCNSMPSKQKMQIKIHYDSTFNADTSDVTSYLDQMVTHVQSHFCQISLGTQIHIEAIGGYTYHADQTWKAESDSNSLSGPIKDIAAADNSGADLGVFMCKDSAFYGTVGLAWVGTMCKTYYSGYNAGVNEKRENVLATSEVVAHEMGHNMGMLHDFDDEHGGSNGPCDGTGIMSYGSAPNVWSTCSRNDFLALYNEIVSSNSLYWCLDDYPSACGGTPPGPTTAPPPTTTAPPPPAGCGSPQWANDQWCDDENNNADCNWDGSACCNNDFGGWDTYCSACECLEPSTTTTAAPTTTTTTTTTTAGPTTTAAPTTTAGPTTTAVPTTQSPPSGECADMPSFMTSADRIVGGEDAPSPIPWQVSVRSGSFHFCGATILDASTLLCAAHCFYQSSASGKSIRAGSVQKGSGGQVRNIASIIWNTNSGFVYNSNTLDNDFVILKLDSPLTLNDDVKPACLPSSAAYLGVGSSEDRCFTSGWGTLSSSGSSPNTCQFVRVPAITNAACNNDYGGSITDSMICAGYPGVGGKDACQGDSGGPFVCNDGGKAVIAGVVSWGNGCALADYPGVYARTTYVLDWIKSQMGSDGTAPPPTTTAPPPTGCGSPQWAEDQWCDDENNNADCNWDGGACCNNSSSDWNNYCSACECLDPNVGTTTTTEAPCVDIHPTKKCEKRKKKGKCSKNWMKKKCAKTCEQC